MRRKIDGHLVALATQGLTEDKGRDLVGEMNLWELEEESSKKVLASASSAALRLKRGSLDVNQRMALIDVFETLGLHEEAKKMEASVEGVIRSGAGRGASVPMVAAPVERIEKLADSGRIDAACRLLTLEFESLARQEVNFATMRLDNEEFSQFKSKVFKLGLKKELLAKLNPGESTSSRKLATWCVAQELFVGAKAAEMAYAKLFEIHPKEDEARLRYLLLRLTTDRSLELDYHIALSLIHI